MGRTNGTTVGYGDNVPVTVAGRIFAVLVMLLGIGFLTVITAAITSAFVARARASDPLRRRRLDSRPAAPDRPNGWNESRLPWLVPQSA